MPTRREISAREIGALERIASSTVRSFMCLSRGGVARVRSTLVKKINANRPKILPLDSISAES